MIHRVVKKLEERREGSFLTPAYGARSVREPVPKYELPRQELPPEIAYNLVRDELILDGNSRLNLATFVTTWMDDEARRLMAETFDKNMIDKDEYPQTAEIEMRCVNILSRLWHAPDDGQAAGCSTLGSSEAAMLGGMALKWQWRKRRQAQGKPADRPNLVMGVNVQVCWEKFCRYWEIEPRLIPMEGERFCLIAEEALTRIDENTIGVVVIMGSTFDGRYENVQEVNDALEKLNKKTGWDVPIHVDGASGGFVAPFLQPKLEWDFRLSRIKSINASGHKFGLVFPGVGWIVWRDREELPEELIFHCNYLGGDLPNFALNFSRPGNQVVAQYYNFLRLGHDGYRRIHQASQDVALHLSSRLAAMGPFTLISDGSDIPVFAFTTNRRANFSVFDMSDKLRQRGWLVPAYTFPKNRQDLSVLRCVCKEGFTRDMADILLADVQAAVKYFGSLPGHQPRLQGAGFHH
ncbi:MAG: glutamate decarboxylase [Pirellulales bacterium]|nr:glutamate decarboxylase [Pirellulales bacterium]